MKLFNKDEFIANEIKFYLLKNKTKEGEKIRLGKKQMEILKILVYNKGNIISREQLIQYVWYTDEVNDRTVDAHISKIRRELGLTCIKSVPGYGYRLEC